MRALRGAPLLLIAFFGAFPVAAQAEPCPNESLRVGPSASLPDCRAYEVVTPDTESHQLLSLIGTEFSHRSLTFNTWMASPDGESLIFNTNGAIQGENANGKTDQYESVRGPQGWTTAVTGPSGVQAAVPVVGGSSPDHAYTFWAVGATFGGTLSQPEKGPPTQYLRGPGQTFTPVGIGSLGEDLEAEGVTISSGGRHVIFIGRKQLEPNAPSTPTETIYDRSPGGPTHVVSLLPGDIAPLSDAIYQGASGDDSAVFFEVAGTMYERMGNAATKVVAAPTAGTELVCNASAEEHLQWLRNGVPIAGAASRTYIVTAADEGTVLQCQSTSTGKSTATSASPTLVAPLGSPSPPQPLTALAAPIPAAPIVGTVESCPSGSWDGRPSFAYQWYRNGEPIAGAINFTYEVEAADLPGTLQCEVIASNAGGSVALFSANTATDPPPTPSAPKIIVTVAGRYKSAGFNEGGPATAIFAGSSADGSIAYYARGEGAESEGGLFEYDAQTEITKTVADEGEIYVVNVSADGSHAYFTSTAGLTGTEANSQGEEAVAGENNLYAWNGSAVKFVATVSQSDLLKRIAGTDEEEREGLARWSASLGLGLAFSQGPSAASSRTSTDGRTLVFQSHRNLTPYDSQGNVEIYRYREAGGELICVSCNPEGTPATTASRLVYLGNVFANPPTDAVTYVPNLTPSGAVVFETSESLVPADEDGFSDVYEWREGQISLISGGQSMGDDYLFGMSADGSDIFFRTNDTLAPQDTDGGGTSIYDARVDGGFPSPTEGQPCEEEACQGGLTSLSAATTAPTSTFVGSGNVSEAPVKIHRKKRKKRRHGKKGHHKPAKHKVKGGK